ncbi:MAG: hydroxymethylglutaryl-CoA reductase, degradative [Polyangia bacterium]
MNDRFGSRIPGFHRRRPEERRRLIEERLGDAPFPGPGLSLDEAERMIENAIGAIEVPLGVATNFTVNGRELLVPMAIEEPSVVAAASNAARMVREGGGFEAEADPPLTVAQIELLDPLPDAAERIARAGGSIREAADAVQPELVALGGGVRSIETRPGVGGPRRLVVHLVVDCRDAMGANTVNTMAEAISDLLAGIAGARAGLRILTNLADRRLARASCALSRSALERRAHSGAEVAEGIVAAWRMAEADPYRAATHNKGIFNGIDALLLATGNDWRAVEAGGHAYAARQGRYGPLSRWRLDGELLHGEIEMPMAVGIVGGASRSHPTARRCIELLGVESATALAEVAVALGLAQNLAALAALCSEGIQSGHMRLHARKSSRGRDQ